MPFVIDIALNGGKNLFYFFLILEGSTLAVFPSWGSLQELVVFEKEFCFPFFATDFTD